MLRWLFVVPLVLQGVNGQYTRNADNTTTPGFNQTYGHAVLLGMDGLPAADFSPERCSEGGRVRLFACRSPAQHSAAPRASGHCLAAWELPAPPRARSRPFKRLV